MFKRIKRLITLSKKDPDALEKLEALSDEQISIIPDAGDGKAEFFGPGSEQEFIEQKRRDDGTDKWYKRIGL